jgi:hypothetical protein
MVRHVDSEPQPKREPCPAGIEDSCPIPRYRCRERGEPGRHCEELFADFETFILPAEESGEGSEEPDAFGQISLNARDMSDALGDVADILDTLPPEDLAE